MFGKSRIKYSTNLSVRRLGWWLDHKCLGSLLFPGNLLLFSFLGCKVVHSSESYTWSRVKEPSSRLIVLSPFLRISMASRILLEKVFESMSRMLASSQLIMCFSWTTWSVIADLCCSVVDAFLYTLGTISDRKFQRSLFSEPKDFSVYSERTSL